MKILILPFLLCTTAAASDLSEVELPLVSDTDVSPCRHTDGLFGDALRITSDDLGTVNVAAVENHDLASVRALLSNYEVFDYLDDASLRVYGRVTNNDGRYSVQFRQHFYSVHADRISTVQFDQNGRVYRISAIIVDPSSAQKALVQVNEAITHAKQTILNHIGEANATATVIMGLPELFYDIGLDVPATPMWQLYIRGSDREDYQVRVNAMSGETSFGYVRTSPVSRQ